MDVWAWVEQLQQELMESGQDRVAQLIDRLPTAVIESDPIADALAPELLAAARAMGNPWLEIYTRHWHLQYQVGTMNYGTKALQYATESLERAHREDAIDCPQSVCTTQDMSMTYESIDYLSFAKDREAVSRETLARVTPRWNCYDCIHRELIDALSDQGRDEEAMELLDHSRNELEAVGNTPSPGYITCEASLQLKFGRADLASALCKRGEEDAEDEPATTQTNRRILWTSADRLLGNFEEALGHFPSPEHILGERTLGSQWAIEAHAMVKAGALENSPAIGNTLELLLQHNERVGSLRSCIEIGEAHAMLAIGRGVRWVGEEAVAAMRRVQPQLAEDHGATEKINEILTKLESVPDLELPVPAAELGAYLNESQTPAEVDVALLRQAVAAQPDDVDLPIFLGISYANAGQHRLLLDHFKRLASTPSAESAGYVALVRALSGSDLPAATVDDEINKVAEKLKTSTKETHQFVGHRIDAELAFRRERFDDCVAACERALLIDADSAQTRYVLATAAMRDKEFEKAAEQLKLLVADQDEPGDLDWDLITASTATGDWATVRKHATRVGITVPDEEGPIDEDVAFCQVLLPGYADGLAPWAAIRTGPASARVIEVSNPKADFQYYNARVVIDVGPVNLDSREEEGDDWAPVFPVVLLQQLGTHRGWILDGAYPGDEQWGTFRDELRNESFGVWSATWDGYEVTNPNGKAPLPGLYAFVASPPEMRPASVDARLRELTKGWQHPLAWITLAEAAGSNLTHHQQIVAAYGL